MKNIRHAFWFAATYPGWHTVRTQDRASWNAIRWLQRNGLVEVFRYSTGDPQFRARITETTDVKQALRTLRATHDR